MACFLSKVQQNKAVASFLLLLNAEFLDEEFSHALRFTIEKNQKRMKFFLLLELQQNKCIKLFFLVQIRF